MRTLTATDLPERPSGLLAAFLVALALHALVLAGLLVLRLAPPAPPGEQAVTVDLAPLMADAPTQAPLEQEMGQVAPPPEALRPVGEPEAVRPVEEPKEAALPPPPAEAAPVAPEEAREPPPQTQAVVEPPPEAPAVEPESQVITSTVERAEPEAPPPPVAARVEEPKVEEAKPEEVKPVVPEKPKPDLAKLKAEREARLRKIREEKQREEERRERLEEIREAREKAAKEAREKAAKEARARAARQAAAQGAERSSASSSRENAAGRAAAGNDPNALTRWKGMLSAAIHGRMNVNAAVGTSGGTTVVSFVVLRSGHVASASVTRSSGVGQIDSAALAAVRGTLPAAPPGVSSASLSVAVPLRFGVR